MTEPALNPPPGRRDTSWFTDILLSQQSDYESPERVPSAQRRVPRPVSRAVNFLALAATGLVLAAAANLVSQGRPVVEQTRQDLLSRIATMQGRTAELETANAQMRARNLRLERYVLPDIDNQLAAQLQRARAQGGYAETIGKGVVIELANPAKQDELNVVYDVDLQVLVNALFAAGAKGVAVDGIRITAATSIREAGGSILVDYQPIAAPYRVLAVGDRLLPKLRKSVYQAWFDDLSDSYGIDITYQRRASVKLPAGRVQPLEYAEEVGQ